MARLSNEIVALRAELETTTPAPYVIDNLIGAYVSTLDVKPSSRNLYARTIRPFFNWIREQGARLDALGLADIVAYKDHLNEQRLSPKTVTAYIVAVRKFYVWAEATKLYPNIARSVKTGSRRAKTPIKQHLPEEKAHELLETVKGKTPRDYAIINLLLRTGLRTIELVRADVGDITIMDGRRVLKVWGKGHDTKDDFVILSDEAYKPIADYLATRGRYKAGDPLFTSESQRDKGGRLTTRSISRIAKDNLRTIGLDAREYTAHSLRHTTAVTILKHGGRLEDVQTVLRHASPVTSQIYVESIKREQRLQNAPEMILNGCF